jgi:hypothetical protein
VSILVLDFRFRLTFACPEPFGLERLELSSPTGLTAEGLCRRVD